MQTHTHTHDQVDTVPLIPAIAAGNYMTVTVYVDDKGSVQSLCSLTRMCSLTIRSRYASIRKRERERERECVCDLTQHTHRPQPLRKHTRSPETLNAKPFTLNARASIRGCARRTHSHMITRINTHT